MSSERVMRWRLLLEEYNPTLNYIKGEKNVLADCLSRAPTETECPTDNVTAEQILGIEPEAYELRFPMEIKRLRDEQQSEFRKNRELRKECRKSKDWQYQILQGHEVLMKNGKIYVPKKLRKEVLQWYHHFLSHPGATRLDLTVGQTMFWPGRCANAKNFVRTCAVCQKEKKGTTKYGHLPAKLAECTPWEKLCVDLIGPYTITLDDGTVLKLHAMTFIDPATSWFEITDISNKTSANMSHKLDQVWLSRYPRPTVIVFDNGGEFKKDFRFIFDDYGIKPKPTTIKNPQANSVLERIHLVLANMIRAKNIKSMSLDIDDPWGSILSSVAYAVRSTYHTTLGATPAQLVFGRDMIYPIAFVAEWDVIRRNKQRLINKSNERENSTRVDYDYKIGDDVLIVIDEIGRKMDTPTQGPFPITEVHANGTVVIRRGHELERISIRRLKPFFSEDQKVTSI